MFGCSKNLCLRLPPYCSLFSVRTPVQDHPSVEGVTSLTQRVHSCYNNLVCVPICSSLFVGCVVHFPNSGMLGRCSVVSQYNSSFSLIACLSSVQHTRISEDDRNTDSKKIQESRVLLCLLPLPGSCISITMGRDALL